MKRRLMISAAIAAVGLSLTAASGYSSIGASPAQAAEHPVVGTQAAQAAQFLRHRPNPYQYLPKVPSFKVTSKTVRKGRPLPTAQLSGIFGVPGGKDVSPQLSWSGFPARTKSFVITMYDPQAPTGSGFWHWVVADLPATTTSLPENAGVPNSKALPAGTLELPGDAGASRYIGGAPPSGSGVHDYYITITALDVPKSGVGVTTSGALLGFSIGSHTIARATLICPTAAH
jgi:Raf kinase inhibitor-like YbhB/YbcL family protein